MITCIIDWLSFSVAPTQEVKSILPQHEQFVITDQVSTRRFYDASYKLFCGGVLSISRSEKQGCLVELSGQPLRNLRNAGITMQQQVQMAKEARSVTRLDFALDVKEENPLWTPQALLDDYKQGFIITKLKANREITNLKQNGGQSVYWGGESSDIQIRVYDKAAELKLLWQAWTRVEMQVRGRTTNALAYDMATQGPIEAGSSWIWRKFKPSPASWLDSCLKTPKKGISEVPRKASSFERWITESIKPAFERHMLIQEDAALIKQLFNDLYRSGMAE